MNEKFRYMSQGYDILAEICEKVTGAESERVASKQARELGL